MEDNGNINVNLNFGQMANTQVQVNVTQNHYNKEAQNLKELADTFCKLIKEVDMAKQEIEDIKKLIEAAVIEVLSEKPKRSLVKHAIEKIEYAGKLGTGLNGLNTVGRQLVGLLQNFI